MLSVPFENVTALPDIVCPVASSTTAVKTVEAVAEESICWLLTSNCIEAAVVAPVGVGDVPVLAVLSLQPARAAIAAASNNETENLVIF